MSLPTTEAFARLLLLVTMHLAVVPSSPGVEPAASFDSTRESSPGLDTVRIVKFIALFDFMCGGAWPFRVGVICLVNSVDERDLSVPN